MKTEEIDDKHRFCRTNCCAMHGCKFGEAGCPVHTKAIRQAYTCEDCEYDGITTVDQAVACSNGAALKSFLSELVMRAEKFPQNSSCSLQYFIEALCKDSCMKKEDLK